MDLPTELRIEILRLVLRRKPPIELWAETGDFEKDIEVWHSNQHRYRMATSTFKGNLPLHLLRTCKQLNREGGQIFYGENYFSCSGMNGWIVAAGWMEKIGRRHYQWLRYLTLPVPFYCQYHTPRQWDRIPVWFMSIHQWANWEDDVKRCLNIPLPKLSSRPNEWVQLRAVRYVTRALIKTKRLRVLDLVLPEWFVFLDTGIQGLIWNILRTLNAKMKSDVQVAIVRMTGSNSDAQYYIPDHHTAFYEQIEPIASLWDWKYMQACYDPKGEWEPWDDPAWYSLPEVSEKAQIEED